jgi:hypothetical protein
MVVIPAKADSQKNIYWMPHQVRHDMPTEGKECWSTARCSTPSLRGSLIKTGTETLKNRYPLSQSLTPVWGLDPQLFRFPKP